MSSNYSNSKITEHKPNFKQGMFQIVFYACKEEDEKSIINEVVNKSWLTESLLNELELAHPSRSDIS